MALVWCIEHGVFSMKLHELHSKYLKAKEIAIVIKQVHVLVDHLLLHLLQMVERKNVN